MKYNTKIYFNFFLDILFNYILYETFGLDLKDELLFGKVHYSYLNSQGQPRSKGHVMSDS